jgi:peptidoglycan DL-endopeptidase CwlO
VSGVPLAPLVILSLGVLAVYLGVSGKSAAAVLRDVMSGTNPGSVTPPAPATPAPAPGGGGEPTPTGTPPATNQSAAEAQAYARGQLARYGWGPDQMAPLIKLWNQESGWNYLAKNKSSGALGIPQSLPASKMASAGADYRTNAHTQIDWGLGYIHGRYGTPAAAWSHEQSHNWY